jgi:hypothetical protein
MKHQLFAFILWAGLTVSAPALTNKVLIIGIDGTMKSALAVARTPNLDLLKSNGCYTVREVSDPVTHSAAAWTSIFTGVWGDKHGVTDPGNSFAGNHLADYPSFFARLEAANSNWNTLAFARWAPITNAVPHADVRLAFGTDAAITAETCSRLTNSNPDVFWMILLDVDSAGHSYGWGPTVSNYVRAIEIADGRVGAIIGALTNRLTYTNENWLVLVQTDHGQHDDPDLEKSRIVWSILSGPSAARGVMWPSPSTVDVCATVLTHMGVPLNPAWKLDARVKGLRPRPSVGYGTNLIFNGDAEWSSGTGQYTINRCIAWWFDTSSTTLGVYGANAEFPSAASPGPADRGANFFLGGTTNGWISQRIDLAVIAADVDDPGVDYTLAGWFGGKTDQNDSAALTARFLDATGVVLGSNTVGNILASDRLNVTGLMERSANGVLPAGARFVEFTLTNHITSGRNDASADNLSFVLTPRPDAPPTILAYGETAGGWQIEVAARTDRYYVLERSTDLESWTEAAPAEPGGDVPLLLTDINAPSSRAFYRVGVRRP